MSTHTRSGFTIIEVMLFLAITGALTVAILVGSSVSINQQRYRDSVNSFKGILQEQYSLIGNVINSEHENPVCTQSEGSLEMSEENRQARGTSDCLVIGRFVVVEPTRVTAYNLIGRPPAGDTTETSDAAVLATYAMSAEAAETYEVSWGARIVQPGTSEETASVLIVRSPLSGSILTYIHDGDQRLALQDMVRDANMVQKDFCVDSDNALRTVQHQGVRIAARAAGQSAVETIGVNLGEGSICE